MIPVFRIDKISDKLSAKKKQLRLNRMRALSRSLNSGRKTKPSLQGDLIYTRIDDDGLRVDTSFLPESNMWVWDLARVNNGKMLKDLFPDDWYEDPSTYEYVRNEDIYTDNPSGELWAEGLLYENRKHLRFGIKQLGEGEQTFLHLLEITQNPIVSLNHAEYLNLHFVYSDNNSEGFPIFRAVNVDRDILDQKSIDSLRFDGGDLVFDLIEMKPSESGWNESGYAVNYSNDDIDIDEHTDGYLGVRLWYTSVLDDLLMVHHELFDIPNREPELNQLPITATDFPFWETPSGAVINIDSEQHRDLKEVLDQLVKIGLYSVRKR